MVRETETVAVSTSVMNSWKEDCAVSMARDAAGNCTDVQCRASRCCEHAWNVREGRPQGET